MRGKTINNQGGRTKDVWIKKCRETILYQNTLIPTFELQRSKGSSREEFSLVKQLFSAELGPSSTAWESRCICGRLRTRGLEYAKPLEFVVDWASSRVALWVIQKCQRIPKEYEEMELGWNLDGSNPINQTNRVKGRGSGAILTYSELATHRAAKSESAS